MAALAPDQRTHGLAIVHFLFDPHAFNDPRLHCHRVVAFHEHTITCSQCLAEREVRAEQHAFRELSLVLGEGDLLVVFVEQLIRHRVVPDKGLRRALRVNANGSGQRQCQQRSVAPTMCSCSGSHVLEFWELLVQTVGAGGLWWISGEEQE